MKQALGTLLTDIINMVKILPLDNTNMPTQNYSTRAPTDHLYILFQMERQNECVYSIHTLNSVKQYLSSLN